MQDLEKEVHVGEDERILSIALHALSLFIGIFSPIIFLFIKPESTYVKKHVYAAFNYHLSYYIYSIIAGLLCFLLIGFLILPLVGIVYFIGIIIAIVKANEGQVYQLTFSMKFFRQQSQVITDSN